MGSEHREGESRDAGARPAISALAGANHPAQGRPPPIGLALNEAAACARAAGTEVEEPRDWTAILAAAIAGDQDSRDRLAARLLDWAQRWLCDVRVQDRGDIAETFATGLSKDRYSCLAAVDPDRREAYMAVTLRHCRVDFARRRERADRHEVHPLDLRGDVWSAASWGQADAEGRSVETAVLTMLLIEEVRRAVRGMPELDRDIFAHYFEMQESEAEVAAQVGRPVGTVSRHVHEIRTELGRLLGTGGVSHDARNALG